MQTTGCSTEFNTTQFQDDVENFSTDRKYSGIIIPFGSFQLLYPREKAHEALTNDEEMDILWYYPFEMALLLKKYGFLKIERINRFLNGSDHMTFIWQITASI